MTPMEIVRKIREIEEITKDVEVKFTLTDAEAAALITPEPSKTAKKLVKAAITEFRDFCKSDEWPEWWKDVHLVKSIQFALDAYAKAKVEEAADRWCQECREKAGCCFDGGIPGAKPCRVRAAILGREGTL